MIHMKKIILPFYKVHWFLLEEQNNNYIITMNSDLCLEKQWVIHANQNFFIIISKEVKCWAILNI